ncbi:cytochrome c biogenesis protein CcsA [Campylobacterota bacterium]|nr:cytochrome c biogenesis protein CcsA [Campylobacterota bacterium]
MNRLSTLVAALALAVSMQANAELIKQAKDAGLVAIPSDPVALKQLTTAKDNPVTAQKIELGKKLYFDPRLSLSGILSCNTCHNLGLGGVDGIPTSIGHQWMANPHHLNAPTVYNSIFNVVQFWDGRAADLTSQALGPIQAIPEMALKPELAEKRIGSIPGYVEEFKRAFNDKVTFNNIGKAIAAFESTLVTPSRFDDFLLGKSTALSKTEQAGLKNFIDKGCASCHNGIGVGGSSMQVFPLLNDYKYANLGDFKGDEGGKVRVPTLRNITETAPYFHNGATWDLEEAVSIMANAQLGLNLTKAEVSSIAVFLKTLEGTKPLIIYPVLPPSNANTPKPQPNAKL